MSHEPATPTLHPILRHVQLKLSSPPPTSLFPNVSNCIPTPPHRPFSCPLPHSTPMFSRSSFPSNFPLTHQNAHQCERHTPYQCQCPCSFPCLKQIAPPPRCSRMKNEPKKTDASRYPEPHPPEPHGIASIIPRQPSSFFVAGKSYRTCCIPAHDAQIVPFHFRTRSSWAPPRTTPRS